MPFARFTLVIVVLGAGVFRDGRAADLRAEALADGCTSCHGIEGKSRGYIPSLDKLSRAEFVRAMQEFQSQKRAATIMNRIVRAYSAEEVALLADYFTAENGR